MVPFPSRLPPPHTDVSAVCMAVPPIFRGPCVHPPLLAWPDCGPLSLHPCLSSVFCLDHGHPQHWRCGVQTGAESYKEPSAPRRRSPHAGTRFGTVFFCPDDFGSHVAVIRSQDRPPPPTATTSPPVVPNQCMLVCKNLGLGVTKL